jgi:uncharacterized protein YidB (DUF937 family)
MRPRKPAIAPRRRTKRKHEKASADQISHALGSDQVKALAALLPSIVDKLTPNGQVGESGNLLSAALSLLKPKS